MRRIKLRALAPAAAAAALLALSAPAEACTVSVTGVAFGVYDTISPGDDDSTGTITALCHPSQATVVAAIEAGSSGSILARTMQNGPEILNYNLYTDLGRTIIWGNGTTGSTVSLTRGNSAGGQRSFTGTIYGRIPALQNVGIGTYNDTLIVTITF